MAGRFKDTPYSAITPQSPLLKTAKTTQKSKKINKNSYNNDFFAAVIKETKRFI